MKFTHWFDRRGLALAFAALTLVGHGAPAALGQEKGDKAARESDSSPEVKDEFAGVKFLKPDSKWAVENTGPQGIQNIVCVANPNDRWAPRFVVQVTSALAMPQGMENRLRLVKIGYRDPQQKAPIQELDTESIQASRVRITKGASVSDGRIRRFFPGKFLPDSGRRSRQRVGKSGGGRHV